MGLGASQARFLQLTARKSNIEYMGQQINQERLSLANESAGLFERSLTITAPTPPSSLDDTYAIPAYTFTDADTGLSKKVLVGYALGALTGAVVLYDTYLPDGTKQENIEVFNGGAVTGANSAAGQEGSDVGDSFFINQTEYESTLDATTATGIDLTLFGAEYDTATGRLTGFSYGSTGSENEYTSEDIVYSAEFNDRAFNEAMNEYEYEKATYDYELERINLETSRIQQQDKSLELKLKKLDTEHTAIQSELDAVQKVITKNIESTFKTFS